MGRKETACVANSFPQQNKKHTALKGAACKPQYALSTFFLQTADHSAASGLLRN
jgi:hypothetical protein